MNTIYFKVLEYDQSSGSIVVSFAGDNTESQNPEDYAPLAYQPANMWPGVTDHATILQNIALAGIPVAEAAASTEALKADTAIQTALASLVGQRYSAGVSELREAAASGTLANINTIEP